MPASDTRESAPAALSVPVHELFSLHGQTALVTGGGGAIGRACAYALADAGARLAILDLDGARAEAVALELRDRGTPALSISADVRDPEEMAQSISSITGLWDYPTIAVNSSGIIATSPAEATDLDEWEAVLSANLTGVFVAAQAEGRAMLRAGFGTIINIVSTAAIVIPHPQKQAAYNSSKWGLLGLTKSLAQEWSGRGVRVNALSPGVIETPLFDESPALRDVARDYAARAPSGRVGQVSDLQGAVVFLASPASAFMTGAHVVVDGGASIL
jgi:NAD(P)-dependent dehydrogenase (short-subunit alcohol dehydrogenase family)